MASSALTLPQKGSEEEWIMDPRLISKSEKLMTQYKCRYGSSIKIIAQGENLIADEFSSSNPNKDWKKYQKSGKELFYCLIEDMSSDAVVCVARSILDFPSVENAKNIKVQRTICDQKRMILDYIHTAEALKTFFNHPIHINIIFLMIYQLQFLGRKNYMRCQLLL